MEGVRAKTDVAGAMWVRSAWQYYSIVADIKHIQQSINMRRREKPAATDIAWMKSNTYDNNENTPPNVNEVANFCGARRTIGRVKSA